MLLAFRSSATLAINSTIGINGSLSTVVVIGAATRTCFMEACIFAIFFALIADVPYILLTSRGMLTPPTATKQLQLLNKVEPTRIAMIQRIVIKSVWLVTSKHGGPSVTVLESCVIVCVYYPLMYIKYAQLCCVFDFPH